MLKVRAAAEVLPISVPIHAQRLIARDRIDQLNLVGFIIGFVMGNCPRAFPHFGAHGVPRGDDLAHALFDQAQIFRREGFSAVKVVIPAILDHRADGDFDVGPDFLNSAGHNMGEVVPDQLQCWAFVLHGVDRDLSIAFDRPLQIPMLAIDLS